MPACIPLFVVCLLSCILHPSLVHFSPLPEFLSHCRFKFNSTNNILVLMPASCRCSFVCCEDAAFCDEEAKLQSWKHESDFSISQYSNIGLRDTLAVNFFTNFINFDEQHTDGVSVPIRYTTAWWCCLDASVYLCAATCIYWTQHCSTS